MEGFVFNPAPGWPKAPSSWVPPDDWTPDPSWPPAPADWQIWIPVDGIAGSAPNPRTSDTEESSRQPEEKVETLNAPDENIDALSPRQPVDELAALRADLDEARRQLQNNASGDLVELDDERVLQEVGIYRYHHPLENSEEFRDRLRGIQERIKSSIKDGDAIIASDMFTFNNSLAKGRKMTADLSKLMLRAYNAEADNCVRSLRAGNVETAKRRLESSVTSIARLGAMMEMQVNPEYHQLRIEEIELTGDFQMKVQEEKENAREERERLREERKAEAELAAERERLDKQRAHYVNAIEALRAIGDEAGIAELEKKVGEVDDAITQNDFRAANIRAGYVYVISNRGAFGENMVKIGLTRRLEPMDRVKELGDASVPFPFDVHALYFSDDAVTLENELHQEFSDRKVNRVNERREFFFATPDEVGEVLAKKVGNLLEFTRDPESTQYLQSKKYWPATD